MRRLAVCAGLFVRCAPRHHLVCALQTERYIVAATPTEIAGLKTSAISRIAQLHRHKVFATGKLCRTTCLVYAHDVEPNSLSSRGLSPSATFFRRMRNDVEARYIFSFCLAASGLCCTLLLWLHLVLTWRGTSQHRCCYRGDQFAAYYSVTV